MGKSAEHLRTAIAGEFNANRKYLEFAATAESENLPNVAYLFRALAEAEAIHLKNHRQALGEDFVPPEEAFAIGTTLQNLESAISGETYETTTMYPAFLKDLKKEQHTEQGKLGALSMQWAAKVELGHAKLLKQAMVALEGGQDLDLDQLWICKVCGQILLQGEIAKSCPVCGHDVKYYQLLER
ncbi:MAG TPA: rubrerythrin family protein [Candidatus Lokiarchaeia archaeon]|nr:rubrerythrin family protein [Candidatus Lokiarchaeia archaeon]